MKRLVCLVVLIFFNMASISALEGKLILHLVGIVTPIDEGITVDGENPYINNDYIVMENVVEENKFIIEFLDEENAKMTINKDGKEDTVDFGKYSYENSTLSVDISSDEEEIYIVFNFNLKWMYKEGGYGFSTIIYGNDIQSIGEAEVGNRVVTENAGVFIFYHDIPENNTNMDGVPMDTLPYIYSEPE
ncbi:hypothetical protein [Marispirochaeta aestuarii]|uniref:hypothetical protein n=1 Tax=Marispirochaeta aestuarii TaxID=1963862 RepID=UPI002ABD8A23|nr:hypothetical protein [Marispirochaeta aestuarii]